MTVSVFVSSRFEEFASLRRRLVARIEEARDMRPVAQDDGRASVQAPLGRSLSALENSDIMVLLLGSTYSGDPLGADMSITHREYERACELEHAVLAFAPLVTTFKDERAGEFVGEVMESGVVGTLLQDDEDSCDRILDSIRDHLLVVDHLADARGDVHGLGRWLLRELEELDAGHMLRDTPSSDFASRWRAYTDLLEQRRMALADLTIGQLGSARRHIAEAHARHEGDWGVEYIAARLAEARGLPTDRIVALEHARRALRILDSFDAPIDPEPLTASTRARRRQACLLLLARLYRRVGDARTAEDYLRQAEDRAVSDADLLAGTPFEIGTLKARLCAERVRLLGGSSDESAEEAAASKFVDLLREYPVVAGPLVNADDVKHFRDRLLSDGLAEVQRLIGEASGLGIPIQRPVPVLSRVEDAVIAARAFAEDAAETLRRQIWSVQGLLEDKDGKGIRWRTDVLSSQLLQLENEQRTLVERHADAVARKVAAEEAAGLAIVVPAAKPDTEKPAHEPLPDETTETQPVSRSDASGSGPPDLEALLADATDRLAASEQRLAEFAHRLKDIPEIRAPSPLVPWPARVGVVIGAVAVLLRIFTSTTVIILAMAAGILLAFAYWDVLGPIGTRVVLGFHVRIEKSRRSAAQSSVEPLRSVVAARRAASDLGVRLAALDARFAQVRPRLGAAMEAQAQVARSLGQRSTATGSDLLIEVARLISRHNQAFSEHPALWWPQFVDEGHATPGTLTCVDSGHHPQGGLLASRGSRARLVRVLEAGPKGLVVSDLSAFFPRAEPEVLRLESALGPLLALSAGDTSPLPVMDAGSPSPHRNPRHPTQVSSI